MATTPAWNTAGLSTADRSAANALHSLFASYGLSSLSAKIISYIKAGDNADTIMLQLQDTSEWRARFAGNEIRRKAGMDVLSPSAYLATESSYRQVMRQQGLPSGFYDNPSDFAGYIGKDVSPQEIQTRAQAYTDFANRSTDFATKQALAQNGMGMGDLAAYFMDKDRAVPLLQQKVAQIDVQTAANRQGLGIDNNRAAYLASIGINQATAESGYAAIGKMLPEMKNLSGIYGIGYDQKAAENEVFNGSQAGINGQQLRSQERATFNGSSKGSVGGNIASGANSF